MKKHKTHYRIKPPKHHWWQKGKIIEDVDWEKDCANFKYFRNAKIAWRKFANAPEGSTLSQIFWKNGMWYERMWIKELL